MTAHLAAFKMAASWVSGLAVTLVGQLSDVPFAEIATFGGTMAGTAFLFRLALSGVAGVKHGEEEWQRYSETIERLEAKVDALQRSEYELLIENAKRAADIVRLTAEVAALRNTLST